MYWINPQRNCNWHKKRGKDQYTLHFSPQLFDTSNVEYYLLFMPDNFDWKRLFE